MSVEVSVDMGDIERNINNIIADVDGKLRRQAGKNAGFDLAESLEANTPVDPTTGKLLLENTVVVGPVREDGSLEIGYGKEAYFRAHFVNMGTESQSGQHFIEKTVETEAEAVMNSYMKELKGGLGL